VISTHAHLDHFGGVLGVVDADTDVPIIAPEHFLEHRHPVANRHAVVNH
jgi:alkyl sulfatase BDS1-like metallo-beta-lactamase superfamily hydrolase